MVGNVRNLGKDEVREDLHVFSHLAKNAKGGQSVQPAERVVGSYDHASFLRNVFKGGSIDIQGYIERLKHLVRKLDSFVISQAVIKLVELVKAGDLHCHGGEKTPGNPRNLH